MERGLSCTKHEEQIKSLFKKDEAMEKRIERLEDDKVVMYNLDKNIALLTKTMTDIAEHNKKQDTRMDEQQQINVKINENLTELAEGQRTLNKRVGKLEERVDDNENKHSIDLRDIEKKKYTDIFFKYILPTGSGLIVLLKILEIWKG